MRYTFIVYHENYGPQFGARWYVDANSVAEAIGNASKICERLSRGRKVYKRQGRLTFTIPEKMED